MKRLVVLTVALFLVSGCVQTEQYCNGMSLEDAKEIAVASECGDRLKTHTMCNEDTNTWWIDLDIEHELCDPACVIHTDTEEAEINWRCTGVIT